MNFALWLEKKDIELYESILNEMQRRQFLQAGLAGVASLGLANSEVKAGSETGKTEINKKPIKASLKNIPTKGQFYITIENAKSKEIHNIQYLIKEKMKNFLENRKAKLKDPYVNIDPTSYLIKIQKIKDEEEIQFDVIATFSIERDLLASYPFGISSNKLLSVLINNKNAYDDDSLTFLFNYTEKRPKGNGPKGNGLGNPLQNPLRK